MSTIHNLAANSTMISESFYLPTEKLILLSKHIMQTSKYPFIEKDEPPAKWHVSDLLLPTTLISEQILRNGFEKTAPFLSYTGGLRFLQALLRSIINRGAWSTDVCLFLWTALLRPLAGPRTTTADSADCRPQTVGIGTGSATSLLKALLQKKPSGQDDIHKKHRTKKHKIDFHGGTNPANKTATRSFLSKWIWSKMDVVPAKQEKFMFPTANEEKAMELEEKPEPT